MNPLVWLHRTWREDRRRVLLAGCALAIAATFLRPTLTLERPRFDLVVVLDITQSMDVADMVADGRPVSRLARARAVLSRAIAQLPCGSRLGWAVFTEYRSFLLFAPVEVCANRAELRSTLAGIDNRMAWVGNSEVAKGLHSAVDIAKQIPGVPAVVFVTDGHEAPPLNPRHRPRFDDKPGEVAGIVVGVGGSTPQPIPKTDPAGRPIGFWGADEVLQTDPRSQGRGASVGGETLSDEGDAAPQVGLGATPGAEHLSSLREPYLKLLAQEYGMAYQRLDDADAFVEALQAPALARPVRTAVDARLGLAAMALVLLLAAWWPQRR